MPEPDLPPQAPTDPAPPPLGEPPASPAEVPSSPGAAGPLPGPAEVGPPPLGVTEHPRPSPAHGVPPGPESEVRPAAPGASDPSIAAREAAEFALSFAGGFPAGEAGPHVPVGIPSPAVPSEGARRALAAPAGPDAEPRSSGEEGRRSEPGVSKLLGVSLLEVPGLQDLPESELARLIRKARLVALAPQEEVTSFAVALVVKGDVAIVSVVADVACAQAHVGDVVFTEGSLENGVELRVVAGLDGAVVAVWDQEALSQATLSCPWVADELRAIADRYQAFAGAVMGKLGERLDESLLEIVLSRCAVRLLLADEPLLEVGQPVGELHIVGAGRILLHQAGGSVDLGPGDFVFPSAVLTSEPASARAVAGAGGALVLVAGRHETHELMVSVPPLLELLSQ